MGKVGRPSTYKPEYCNDLLTFFEKARNLLKKEEIGRPRTKQTERPSTKKDPIYYKKKYPIVLLPTLERFSTLAKIPLITMTGWKKQHPEWKETVAQCMAIQKDMLIQMTLNGYYNAATAKLILQNCHGFTEKEEVTNKGTITLKFDHQDTKA